MLDQHVAKMNKIIKISLTVISIFITIVTLFSMFLYITTRDSARQAVRENVTEAVLLTPVEYQGKITVTASGGDTKRVTNTYHKYQIDIPGNWLVPEYTALGGTVSFYPQTVGDSPYTTESYEEESLMDIYVQQNTTNIALTDWISDKYDFVFEEVGTNTQPFYKAELREVDYEEGVGTSVLYITNNNYEPSLIYVISCWITGVGSVSSCDNIASTFLPIQ